MNGQLPNQEVNLYETLNLLTKEIRAGLEFAPGIGIGEEPSAGNCYEFALRTDDNLTVQSHQSLSSAVVYAQDHAFNAGDAYGTPFVLSSDVPGLLATGDKTPALVEVFLRDEEGPELEPFEALKTIDTLGSLACYLNMARLREGILAHPPAIDKIEKYNKWFSEVWLNASLPIATIMEPEFAREALTNYFMFRKGIADPDLLEKSLKPDFEVIREALEQLRIRTPQHETRPRFNRELELFKKAIRMLSRKGGISAEDLSGTVEQYIEILPSKNTAANVVFGDCYRAIGEAKDNQPALDMAEAIYERAMGYTGKIRAKDMITSKISKARNYKSKLAGS